MTDQNPANLQPLQQNPAEPPNWEKIASSWWGEQPSPDAPEVKLKDYPTAVKLATAAKFGGHATAQEAAAFWKEFTGLNERLMSQNKPAIQPDEYEQLLEHLAPLAFTYHDRPPYPHEIARLRDATPAQARQHYADLPDKNHPDVTAGQMVQMLKAAEPAAQRSIQRPPLKMEAAYLIHSQQSPTEYYAAMNRTQGAQEVQGVVQTQAGGGAGGSGAVPSGGQAPGE
jgi:hypothetical protein